MIQLYKTDLKHLKGKCGIYLIKISERLYVGSSLNLRFRLSDHIYRLRKKNHHNSFMQSCFNKHGEYECFYTILEECSEKERLQKEKYWIDKLSPQLNLIKNPMTQHNCITTSKIVYQYTLSGNFIQSYISAQEAARKLNLNGNSISRIASGNNKFHKSHGKSLWSYEKHKTLPEYTNGSAVSKIKGVTMYNRDGKKIRRFESIASAARYIQEPHENFDVLCACISSAAHKKGIFVKNTYRFSYEDYDNLITTLKRDFPVVQILPDGKERTWKTVKEAAKELKGKPGGIHKVLRGEREKYHGCKWKRL